MNTIIIFKLILITMISCEKGKNEEGFPIDFTYEILNDERKASEYFKYGENFTLSLKIINNTSDTIYYYPEFIYSEDFFIVYKKINNNYNEKIGKPFKEYYCLEIGLLPFLYPKSETFINVPWKNNNDSILNSEQYPLPIQCKIIVNNPILEKGEYYSDFTFEFKYFLKNHDKITKEINVSNKFIVK